MGASYLMLPDNSTTWSILAVVLLACCTGLAAWWRRAKPARERAEAGWDAILGVAEVKDLGGGVSVQARPGLIHRVTELEHAVVTLADQQAQIRALRTDLRAVRVDVDALKSGVVEKAAMRLENAALFDMVTKRDSDVVDEPTD